MSRRITGQAGRRDVYIAQYRVRGRQQDHLQMIRFHKWGVRERLDEGKPLLQAMIESEEYTDYIMDRRLACRQLGMNLPPRGSTHRIQEQYFGKNRALHGITIWSPYYRRAYIAGISSDKLPVHKLHDAAYAFRLAELLGHAAASNIIVGRTLADGSPVFDDGDEVIVEDVAGHIADIIVSDHTGAFTDFKTDLALTAPAYAAPIMRRAAHLPDPIAFTEAYCNAFEQRFRQLQNDYRRRGPAFDALLQHRPRDPAGNLAYRWQMILQRLNNADATVLANIIRKRAGYSNAA
ncbi:MAG: hypothetical protein QM770_03305 [Tepidisphaeraceae bacterium]